MNPENKIRAAEGYSELGMYAEALCEIQELPAAYRDHPTVLSICGHSQIMLKDWQGALQTFTLLIEIAPKNPDGFLHKAYCLHELNQTSEAKDILVKGAIHLKGNPIFYYNLACYECLLGNLDIAEELLEQSFEMDEKFKRTWLTDPDLIALRARFLKE